MKFQDLGLSEPLLRAIGEKGYTDPTPIQQQAIPPALEGRDLQGCAQTGTGKTAAFTLPILQLLAAEPAAKGRREIRALVVTPTRELAIQIDECCRDYARYLAVRHCVIFGGVNQRPQVDVLQRGVDLLVATPGRLLDLVGQGHISLDKVRFFVLDEADRMLDMGFIHDIRRILPLLPARRQTLFFSATMPPDIAQLAAKILHDPVLVTVTPPASVVETISQRVHFAEKAEKSRLLIDLLEDSDAQQVLVFTRTKHGADKLAKILNRAGIQSSAIHGNKSQNARVKAMNDFKGGACRVLIATDIAARGIDIDQLPLVINYDLPEVAETYVHRIGRTGRAGKGGTAISFCDITEKPCLKDVERLIGRKIPVVEGHAWPMVVLEAPAKDAKGRAVNPEDAEARAAAKAKRQERAAAEKAAGERRAPAKQAAPAKKAEPARQAEPAPVYHPDTPEEIAAKKKRGRGRRNSATLEAALTATAPARAAQHPGYDDFEKPDPLASDVIMDATARLLAPRKPVRSAAPAQEPAPAAGAAKRRRKKKPAAAASPVPVPAPAAEKFPPKRASGAPVPEKKRAGGGKGRGRHSGPPEIRRSSQKDSTEQPSLMKPYYLSDD